MGIVMAIYWDIAWVYNKNIWISLSCDPKFLYQSGYTNWRVDIETKENTYSFDAKEGERIYCVVSVTNFLVILFTAVFFCICKVWQLKIVVVVNLSAVR